MNSCDVLVVIATLSRIFALSVACGATTPASSPVVSSCNACTAAQLTFTPANAGTNPVEGTVVPSAITQNAQGCSQLMVSCTGPNAGLLQFNTLNNGAPSNCAGMPVNPCTATLICNSNGQWTFTDNGATRIVTVVTCQIF